MSIPQSTTAHVFIIAGLTGSGKTALLQYLQRQQLQVLDIETMCRHDGSVFATLQYPTQPSAYQFHKQLLTTWHRFDPAKPVFIESELKKLGRIVLPGWLYEKMLGAPVIWLNTPRWIRTASTAAFIRRSNPIHFCDCLSRLHRKLGDDKLELAITYFQQEELEKLADLLLDYYDHVAGYRYPEERVVLQLPVECNDVAALAESLIKEVNILCPNL